MSDNTSLFRVTKSNKFLSLALTTAVWIQKRAKVMPFFIFTKHLGMFCNLDVLPQIGFGKKTFTKKKQLSTGSCQFNQKQLAWFSFCWMLTVLMALTLSRSLQKNVCVIRSHKCSDKIGFFGLLMQCINRNLL